MNFKNRLEEGPRDDTAIDEATWMTASHQQDMKNCDGALSSHLVPSMLMMSPLISEPANISHDANPDPPLMTGMISMPQQD